MKHAVSGTAGAFVRSLLAAAAPAAIVAIALSAPGGPAAAQPGMPAPVQPALGQPGSPPAQSSAVLPVPLRQVGYDQRLGAQLPLDLPFRDERGRPLLLREAFQGRPVILVLAYYDCPMLCGVVLTDLVASLKTLQLEPGRDFEVVVASIDPTETPQQAFVTKRDALVRYGRKGTDGGWHFLTGSQPSIDRLTRAVGFRYTHDAATGEFAHAAGIVIATPDGWVSRYLLGLEYPPRDVRLGLIESAGGRIGTVVDKVLLYCFHYDPAAGRYSAMTINIVRLGGIATVLGLGLLVAVLRRREPKLQGAA